MSVDRAARALAPDTAVPRPADDEPADNVIWLHQAFCGMALPIRATRGAWQRDIEAASIRIEPASADEVVPSGRILRLSLMHICDTAFRANSQVVDLGEDATAVGAALGVDPKTRDLSDQWQRLQAARVLISVDGNADVSVFDARSRRRAGDTGWRSAVRLSTKFLASLVDRAVPLDRNVVHELSATPAALDAYAWIRMLLHRATADQVVTTSWDELLRRFGTASQDLADFRSTFEAALHLVFEAEGSVDLAVNDEGVSVRRAEAAQSDVAAPVPPAATVIAASTAQRQEPTTPPVTAVMAAHAAPPEEPLKVPPTTPALPDVHAIAADPPTPEEPPSAPTPVAETARPAVLHERDAAPRQVDAEDQTATDRITQDSISLPRHQTGLAHVIWLRRGHGAESVLVGVTPSARFDAERLTVLAVEPMVIQVSGGLNEKDFERVSAWVMTNRDVIDEFWDGGITTFAEIDRRVRKAPAPGWR